jgi:hypothetical protein
VGHRADATGAAGNILGARPADAVVPGERTVDVPGSIEEGSERGGILDGLIRALSHVRRHGVRGITKIDEALDALDGALGLSRRENIIPDVWSGVRVGRVMVCSSTIDAIFAACPSTGCRPPPQPRYATAATIRIPMQN